MDKKMEEHFFNPKFQRLLEKPAPLPAPSPPKASLPSPSRSRISSPPLPPRRKTAEELARIDKEVIEEISDEYLHEITDENDLEALERYFKDHPR
jgi:hypothetical protein